MTSYPTVILPIISNLQNTDYHCGPASLQCVLDTIGRTVSQDDLSILMKTNEKRGTEPDRFSFVLKKLRIPFVEKQPATIQDIEGFIRSGKACIVLYQAWGTKSGEIKRVRSGHYSVIFGYSDEHLYVADPYQYKKKLHDLKGFRKIRKDIFMSRWKDRYLDDRILHRWLIAIPVIH